MSRRGYVCIGITLYITQQYICINTYQLSLAFQVFFFVSISSCLKNIVKNIYPELYKNLVVEIYMSDRYHTLASPT